MNPPHNLIRPYDLPEAARAPLSPEEAADSEEFRADLRTRIERARATGEPAYVPAPQSVTCSRFDAFWAAVEARLDGTGWAILPRAIRGAGRGRVIGPAQ